MPDSVGAGGFPRNINIGHEHLDLSSGFTYQYQGGVPTDILSWKIIGGVTSTDPSTVGWGTNQLGAMWFNLSDRSFKMWTGTEITTIRSGYNQLNDYKTTIFLNDDFLSGGTTSGVIGALGWQFNGGTVGQQSSEEGRPGLIRRGTSAASGTIATTYIGFITSLLPSSWNIRAQFQVRLNQVDTDTAQRVGIMNSTNADPPGAGVYFEKLLADTTWNAVIRTGGSTQQRADTGIAVDTNFHKFEVVVSGAIALFYLDNNLVGGPLSGSGFPTGSVSPCAYVVNGAAADKTMDLDYFQMLITGFPPRT